MYISKEIDGIASKFSSPPFDFRDCFECDQVGEAYFKQIIIHAFSIPLPSGEKFFIDVVKKCAKLLKNRSLDDNVSIFLTQEALHRKSHINYNEALCSSRGYDLVKLESIFLFNSKFLLSTKDIKYCLAATVCLEHLTASASEASLKNPHWLHGLHPNVVDFWQWHAIEELDHRAVAYDIYIDLYDDTPYLHEVMKEIYPKLARFLESTILRMVSADGESTSEFKSWMKNSKFIVGESGVLSCFENLVEKFFVDGFHPATHFDDTFLNA